MTDEPEVADKSEVANSDVRSDDKPVGGVPHEPIVYKENPTTRDQLRHSVHLHMMIMNGPTQQLAVFLAKALDFMPDYDDPTQELLYTPEALASVDAEMKVLAFSIVEAVALHIQRSVDDRAARAQQRGDKFPVAVRQKGDDILVVLGKNRSTEDQIAAKDTVLKAIAEALRALATVTRAKYPEIRNASGNVL
jgi:hypothetical protein